MSSGSHGFFTMLLTAVPLLAVPALAIFGIPQFAPMSASPHPEDEERELLEREISDESDEQLDQFDPWQTPDRRSRLDEARNRMREKSTRQRPDEFSGASQNGDTLGSIANGPSVAIREPSESIAELETDSAYLTDREALESSPSTVNESTEPRNNTSASPMESSRRAWKNSIRELNRLGINDYRLEPGSEKETFLFHCVLPSRDKPRVSRRFEAESDDPLQALAQVIRQVREYLGE